jgi:hypothetical protein
VVEKNHTKVMHGMATYHGAKNGKTKNEIVTPETIKIWKVTRA